MIKMGTGQLVPILGVEMSYLLKQDFLNGSDGERYRAGTTLTSLPWLTAEQIQACLKEGSLVQKNQEPEKPKPDDLTQLPHVTPEMQAQLNVRGVWTYADVVNTDLTFLQGVGVSRATQIKSAAAGTMRDAPN